MIYFLRTLAYCISFSLLLFINLSAQVNVYLRSIQPTSTIEQQPLQISVGLNQSSAISTVTLFYRQFGQSEFRSQEMQMMRDSAVTEIPASEALPPFLEVYVRAVTQDGIVETLPLENPEINPARITINIKQIISEIIVLSPEEGEQITEGETYISVSFVYASDDIDRKKTKIVLNNIDLSDKALIFDDLLIIPPEGIPSELTKGGANLEIQTFDTTGKSLDVIRRSFNVVTQQQAEEIKNSFQGYGNAQAESRQENIKGTSKSYNRLDARGYGSYLDFLKANANLTLTSEEKPENQPQNRYYLGLDARYAKLGLGDAYPRFPFTIMDGRRIRGYTFDVLLGAFNLNAASGQVLRRVENNSIPQTLERNMTIVRPSFGKGEKFQWGFTYMKSKDEFDPNQPITVRPQENVVMGSDIMLGFDDRRIEITAQTALSLSNVDISRPEFTDDSIDAAVARGTFTQDDADNLKKILPIAKQLITVNENLAPVDPTGFTSLVYETGISLNYFGNFLKGTLLYHGKDYNSTGASAIRKDIRGFNVIDRIRLLSNRLFLTGSFEKLENNISGSEIATTTYNTINTSVSYFPIRDYPNITIGYGLNTNSNPLNSDTTNKSDIEKQIALRATDDHTNRYFLQTSYDFTRWGRHNLSLNMDISNKDDRTIKQQDVSTFNMSILGSTVHDERLESTVGLSFSSLSFPQADSLGIISQASIGYQTISLSGRYKLYEEVLRLTGTLAPTFGDLSRILFETSLQYTITENQTAVFQFQFIRNSSSALSTLASKNDSYVSLLYRIDF